MIPYIFIAFFVALAIKPLPDIKTSYDLAIYAECKPDNIAYWIGQHDYEVIDGWMTSAECMDLASSKYFKGFDCKCSAVIAKAALNHCVGYEARILTLERDEGAGHAITVYTGPKGQRGVINGISHKRYSKDTDWNDIIEKVSGGPWRIRE